MKFFRYLTLCLVATTYATEAHALAIDFSGGSLHGSSGSLITEQTIATELEVTWTLDTSTFVTDGSHDMLTHAGFKIGGTATFESADPALTGTVSATAVSNHGCGSEDSSGFICFAIDAPYYDAVAGDQVSITFTYTLDGAMLPAVLAISDMSFAGNYGLGSGWVISEGGGSPSAVSEPSTLGAFGSALAFAGLARRRLRSSVTL